MFKRNITNAFISIILLLVFILTTSSTSSVRLVDGAVIQGISSTAGTNQNNHHDENSVKKKKSTINTHEQIRLTSQEQQQEMQQTTTWLARKLVKEQDNIRHEISKSSFMYSRRNTSGQQQQLVPASRQLELSQECQQELSQIEAANITLVPAVAANNTALFNITQSDVEKFCSTNLQKRTVTCDYTDLFNTSVDSFRESCQNVGGVIDNFRMKIFFDDFTFAGEPLTIVFNNIPSCIGPSCDRDEYIDYVQEVILVQQQNSSSTSGIYGGYSIEFSAGYHGRTKAVAGGGGTIVLLLVLGVFVFTAEGMFIL